MDIIRSLRDKQKNAARLLRESQNERDRLMCEATTISTQRIQAFYNLLFKEQLEKQIEVLRLAQSTLDSELEARALTGFGAPFPIGTKMVKHAWKTGPTIYGIVAVATSALKEKYPFINVASGTFIIRYLVGNHPLISDEAQLGNQYDTSFHNWNPVDPTIQRNKESQSD